VHVSEHTESGTAKHFASPIGREEIQAVGNVYGDIGTSPIYTLMLIFTLLPATHDNVLGVISAIIWALILLITIKYMMLVLRADRNGEGGVFALLRLINQSKACRLGAVVVLSVGLTNLLKLGAGLLYGDAAITPAISVLSAVEGLSGVHPMFQEGGKIVLGSTLVILLLLFSVQKYGTAKISGGGGVVMLLFFGVIGVLGFNQIFDQPAILLALNPAYAIQFFAHMPWGLCLITIGFIMLAFTGGEATYADLSHFNRRSIQRAWLFVVFPALLLNYLGQGAYLLQHPQFHQGSNVFFAITPSGHTQRVLMVLLTTLATVIASQALITGAYALTTQAISLKLLPRLRVQYTNAEHEGQTYLPFVNWLLFFTCVFLVLGFKTSSNLAGAYGLAVSGVMLITSLAMILVSHEHPNLHWPWWLSIGVFGGFALIDGVVFTANSLKFLQGGYIPVTVGLALFAMMQIWNIGRRLIALAQETVKTLSVRDYLGLVAKRQHHSGAVRVHLVSSPYSRKGLQTDQVPYPMIENITNRSVPPEFELLVCVVNAPLPRVNERTRLHFEMLSSEGKAGYPKVVAVTVTYGWMEIPNLEREFEVLQKSICTKAKTGTWQIVADRVGIAPSPCLNAYSYLVVSIFLVMRRLTPTLFDSFNLGEAGKRVSITRHLHRATSLNSVSS
jgi:KUP system potassium uptake protein